MAVMLIIAVQLLDRGAFCNTQKKENKVGHSSLNKSINLGTTNAPGPHLMKKIQRIVLAQKKIKGNS